MNLKWPLPIVIFVVSNLWGLYGGIPFTIIEPSRPLIERSIGSLQVASTLFTLAEAGGLLVNTTTPEPPTMPLLQAHANATVDPASLPKIGKHIIKNPIDLIFNWVRSHSIPQSPPQPLKPPKSEPRQEETKASNQGHVQFMFAGSLFAILIMQMASLNSHQSFQRELKDIIGIQTKDINNIRAGLGYMYGPIIGAQEELQELRRSFRSVERLPRDLTRLSRELEETLQARFDEIRQTRVLDRAQVPSEGTSEAASAEREKFWKDTWTQIKDDLKNTAEGFQNGMNVFLDLHMGVLSTIADAFQQQYQRSSAAMAAELARAFVSQSKSQEVDIKIENTHSDGQNGGDGSGSQDDAGDLLNFDELK